MAWGLGDMSYDDVGIKRDMIYGERGTGFVSFSFSFCFVCAVFVLWQSPFASHWLTAPCLASPHTHTTPLTGVTTSISHFLIFFQKITTNEGKKLNKKTHTLVNLWDMSWIIFLMKRGKRVKRKKREETRIG